EQHFTGCFLGNVLKKCGCNNFVCLAERAGDRQCAECLMPARGEARGMQSFERFVYRRHSNRASLHVDNLPGVLFKKSDSASLRMDRDPVSKPIWTGTRHGGMDLNVRELSDPLRSCCTWRRFSSSWWW